MRGWKLWVSTFVRCDYAIMVQYFFRISFLWWLVYVYFCVHRPHNTAITYLTQFVIARVVVVCARWRLVNTCIHLVVRGCCCVVNDTCCPPSSSSFAQSRDFSVICINARAAAPQIKMCVRQLYEHKTCKSRETSINAVCSSTMWYILSTPVYSLLWPEHFPR